MYLLPQVLVLVAAAASAAGQSCAATSSSADSPLGLCPGDFTIIGGTLEPIHESATPPAGLAVDADSALYLAYPRNGAGGSAEAPNVVLAASFTGEEPWPSAEMQHCAAGQDPATCFVNVQNVVLDSLGLMWAVDSGMVPGQAEAAVGAAKLMAFNTTTRQLVRTVPLPAAVLAHGMNANDVRINNTAGRGGFAFITDASPHGSLVAVDLATGGAVRRLFNTSVVSADPGYVGSYNGLSELSSVVPTSLAQPPAVTNTPTLP